MTPDARFAAAVALAVLGVVLCAAVPVLGSWAWDASLGALVAAAVCTFLPSRHAHRQEPMQYTELRRKLRG